MITSREETYHHVDQDQHPPALLAQGSSTQGALRAFVTHVSERGCVWVQGGLGPMQSWLR